MHHSEHVVSEVTVGMKRSLPLSSWSNSFDVRSRMEVGMELTSEIMEMNENGLDTESVKHDAYTPI